MTATFMKIIIKKRFIYIKKKESVVIFNWQCLTNSNKSNVIYLAFLNCWFVPMNNLILSMFNVSQMTANQKALSEISCRFIWDSYGYDKHEQ